MAVAVADEMMRPKKKKGRNQQREKNLDVWKMDIETAAFFFIFIFYPCFQGAVYPLSTSPGEEGACVLDGGREGTTCAAPRKRDDTSHSDVIVARQWTIPGAKERGEG